MDREHGDEFNGVQNGRAGPPVPGKSYDRRVIIRSDFVTTVFQLSPTPPSYLSNAPINNVLFDLFDTQRLMTSNILQYPDIELCVQVHVDHRKHP